MAHPSLGRAGPTVGCGHPTPRGRATQAPGQRSGHDRSSGRSGHAGHTGRVPYTSAEARAPAATGRLVVPGQESPISTALALAAVVALVLANGFFVATEFSFVAVRRTRIQQLAADGDARARTVLGRLDHLDAYIAATQLGITLASLALGWIGEPALAHLIEPALEHLPGLSEARREAVSRTVGFALAFAIITVLHIVFGELAPKSLALQRPEATSLWTAGPIHLFFVAFRPVIFALNAVGNAVVRALGIEPAQGHERVQSAEELMLAVDASREAGLVDPAAHDVVDRAFAFADLGVGQVMVPRTELTAVPVAASLPEVLRVAAASGFTRLPAYAGSIDRVVGVLDVRRLLPLLADLAEAAPATGFAIDDHLRAPRVIPASMPAADVFALLRDAGAQTAIVLDEYGGTAGMVSLEDLVRALLGTGPHRDGGAPSGGRQDD